MNAPVTSHTALKTSLSDMYFYSTHSLGCHYSFLPSMDPASSLFTDREKTLRNQIESSALALSSFHEWALASESSLTEKEVTVFNACIKRSWSKEGSAFVASMGALSLVFESLCGLYVLRRKIDRMSDYEASVFFAEGGKKLSEGLCMNCSSRTGGDLVACKCCVMHVCSYACMDSVTSWHKDDCEFIANVRRRITTK